MQGMQGKVQECRESTRMQYKNVQEFSLTSKTKTNKQNKTKQNKKTNKQTKSLIGNNTMRTSKDFKSLFDKNLRI